MIIKTERSLLARLIDTLLTLLAWCCLIYLVGKAVLTYTPSQAGSYLPTLSISDWSGAHTLLTYLLVALFNALLLIAWARYNQYRFQGKSSRQHFKPVASEELCQRFGQNTSQLQKLRQSRISTLEHNEQGQLVHVRVESASPGIWPTHRHSTGTQA